MVDKSEEDQEQVTFSDGTEGSTMGYLTPDQTESVKPEEDPEKDPEKDPEEDPEEDPEDPEGKESEEKADKPDEFEAREKALEKFRKVTAQNCPIQEARLYLMKTHRSLY